MQAKFTVSTRQLGLCLSVISRLKPKFFKKDEFLNIRVLPETIEISTPGIIKVIKAETDGLADISIPAVIIKGYVDTSSVPLMQFTFKPGEMHVGSSIYSSPAITMESLFNMPESELPINATNMYLLSFAKRKGPDQIKKLGLEPLINKATRDLSVNITKALGFLQEYGVTYEELEGMVKGKIGG